jgi:hypothetical protein
MERKLKGAFWQQLARGLLPRNNLDEGIMKAISIPGPWWWFLFYPPAAVRRDVINHREPCAFRGWSLIHAGAILPPKEFRAACDYARHCGVTYLPEPETLKQGGIVGMVKVLAHQPTHESRWYMNQPVLVIEEAEPDPFWPCPGGPGFFEPVMDPAWKPNGTIYQGEGR